MSLRESSADTKSNVNNVDVKTLIRKRCPGALEIVKVKSQRKNMMNMQTSKGSVQSQSMTSLNGISQKIWLSVQVIISTNLSPKKIFRKAL